MNILFSYQILPLCCIPQCMWKSTIGSRMMSGVVTLRMSRDHHLLVSCQMLTFDSVHLASCLVIIAQEDQLPLANIPPAMQRHSQYLKELYKRRLGMSLKWPPVLMKDFVNLLCIENHNKQNERLTEEMVHGHIDIVE